MRFPRPGTSQGTALRGNQGPRGSFRLCASYLAQDPTADAAAAARVPAPPAVSPRRNRAGRAARASLAALLDVRADELLGVLLKHLVDLVEDRVHVVGELLMPLLDLLGRGGLVLLGLLSAPRRLPLAPGVLRCHVLFLRPWKEPNNSSNVILAPMSSAQPSAGVSVRTHLR